MAALTFVARTCSIQSQHLSAAIDFAPPGEGTAEPAPQKPLSQLVDAETPDAGDRIIRSRAAMARIAST